MKTPDCKLVNDGGIWHLGSSPDFGAKWVRLIENAVCVSYAVATDIFMASDTTAVQAAIVANGIDFFDDLSNWSQGSWIEGEGSTCTLNCVSHAKAKALVEAILSAY